VRVVVEDVAEDERGAFQPGDRPERPHVRLHDEIAVALRPVRRRVAGHRLHVDIVGHQVVAGMRLVGVEEELRLEALADQPPLHVDKADEDGVDRPRCGGFLQLVERQVSSHVPLLEIRPL
jgi:hypothetical protein